MPLEGRQLKSLQDLPEQRRLFQTSLHVRWRSSQGEGKYLGSHIQKEMWPGRLGGRWGQTFKCLKTVCCKVWCFPAAQKFGAGGFGKVQKLTANDGAHTSRIYVSRLQVLISHAYLPSNQSLGVGGGNAPLLLSQTNAFAGIMAPC